ncbi:MAG TPA: hypothetical protein VKQ52_00455 [Puia sp.]|nr:hypothetical protein [Puia sp.]
MAGLLPGISGLAAISPGLTFLDIPLRLPLAIDLILVPGLFLLAYMIILLVYASRRDGSTGFAQRLGAVFVGGFIVLFCTAFGFLLTYLMQDHLPLSVRRGMNSFGISADLYLPSARYKTIHLQGNFIALLCFIIGIALCIRKIKAPPVMQKVAPLTREQRMTPYERMMEEKRKTAPAAPKTPKTPKKPSPVQRKPSAAHTHNGHTRNLRTPCYNQPLLSIEPEAVNYMPM